MRSYDDERECPECGNYDAVEVLADEETRTEHWKCSDCGADITEHADDDFYDDEEDDYDY